MQQAQDASGAADNRPQLERYGVVIVLTGVAVMFSCLGLARFSFGILLPPMARALELDYSQQGVVGTGYFIGYVAMVGMAPFVTRRLGHRAAVAAGLGLIAASTCLLGAVGGYVGSAVCYTITGVGSGAANISMMALVTAWFPPGRRGTATGLVIAGNGLGIMASGLIMPGLVRAVGEHGWRAGWISLGAASALICVLAAILLRNPPLMAKPKPAAPAEGQAQPAAKGRGYGFLTHLGLVYFLFGVTYIVYSTFIVTTMVDEHGMGQAAAGRFWAWVGFFSLFSGPLAGRISDVLGRRAGLLAAFGMQSAAYLLAGMGFRFLGTTALYLSVGLFGLAAWSVPTVMAAFIADRLGPVRTAQGFSFITFFFAVGQVLGPYSAGRLAEVLGGFSPAYTLSGCLTLTAMVLALALRPGRSAAH